ncbi:MAG: AI-2E family transporter [Bacteroidales bacterium]|nr:AI-2E family transporter [Bacteroidales bacterium]
MSSFFKKEFTFDRVARIFFVTVLVLAVGWFLLKIKDALIPFLIGWLIAAIFYPVVKLFQYKLRFKFRILAIFATIFCLVGVITLLIWLVVPPAMSEIDKTSQLIKNYEAQFKNDPFLPNQIKTYINKFVDIQDFKETFDYQQLYDSVKKYIPKILNIVEGAIAKIFNFISLVFILLYAFFILLYYEDIRDGFYSLLPGTWGKKIKIVIEDFTTSTSRYFKGQTLVASIVGILFAIGFLIIGLPMAIPLGLFIGLLNMIPYAQFIGIFPTIILCLIHSADTGIPFWRIFIFSLMVYAVVQITEDTLLTPKIMGKVTGLNPAIILLSLSIGGVLFGIIGIIMALPVATMLLSYYHIYILKDTEKPKIE